MEHGLLDGEDDAWLALMSPFLQNIEKLHRDFLAYPSNLTTLVDYNPSRTKSLDAVSPFSTLTEISVTANEDGYEPPSFVLWTLFGLSSLRRFLGYAIFECAEDEDFLTGIDESDKAWGFSAVTHV